MSFVCCVSRSLSGITAEVNQPISLKLCIMIAPKL